MFEIFANAFTGCAKVAAALLGCLAAVMLATIILAVLAVVCGTLFDALTQCVGKRLKKPRTKLGKILRDHADGV